MNCPNCGMSNLTYTQNSYGKSILFNPQTESPHQCTSRSKWNNTNDYLVCVTHRVALKEGTCPRSESSSPCRLYVERSKLGEYDRKISNLNNHDHKWFRRNDDNFECMICHKTPEKCGIYDLSKIGIPVYDIPKQQSPLDCFLVPNKTLC
jgi:hypothetical protein